MTRVPLPFKIDENLPVECAELFVAAGHDATTVLGQGHGGEKDPTLADLVKMEDRIFVTLDLDFADIRVYPPTEYPGFVVFRLARQDKPYVVGVMNKLLQALQAEAPTGSLWIVEEDRIRIRQ